MNNSPTSRLLCHPSTPCRWIECIAVTVIRSATDGLRLCFEVLGECSRLRLPSLHESRRTDELWRHTCAELFMTMPGREGYFEFNFSPSGEWAAYQFDDYRRGMRPANVAMPEITCESSADKLLINVTLKLPELLARAEQLQAGLTMVIETTNGEYAYWALAHGGERPDFHRRDSFVLTI